MHTRFRPFALRILEGVANDALDALAGIDVFLHGNFVGGSLLEESADAHVKPFGVLAKDHQANIFFGAAVQRSQPLVQQFHRPGVHVEIELEAQAQQNVGGVLVGGHTRIAERAKQDGVEFIAQHFDRAVGQANAFAQEICRRPNQTPRTRWSACVFPHTAFRTFTASGVTSLPMPSPGITAIRAAVPPWRMGNFSKEFSVLVSPCYVSRSTRVVSFSMRSRRGSKPMPGPCGTAMVPRGDTVTSGSMMSSCPVALAGGNVAGQREIRQRGKRNVVRAADARLEHAAAPHRHVVLLAEIVNALCHFEAADAAQLDIDNFARAQSHGRERVLVVWMHSSRQMGVSSFFCSST